MAMTSRSPKAPPRSTDEPESYGCSCPLIRPTQPRSRSAAGVTNGCMLTRSDSGAPSMVTQCRSCDVDARRTATCSGAIAAATMVGAAMEAGDSTTQFGTVRSSCARAVPSNMATKRRIPGRMCSTIRQ